MAELVHIGTVGKAHGIRGDVYVRSESEVPDRFAVGIQVKVGAASHTIASSRTHSGRLLVRFEGVEDRTAAELLRGCDILGPAVDTSESDNYYAHDLVGMTVVTEDGTWLGEVVDIEFLPTAAGYDLLDVDADGVTWQLPDPDELVEVAEADGTDVLMVIDPPAGLIPDELLDGQASRGESS